MSGRRNRAQRKQRADETLEAVYAEIPDMADCRGLCHDSCGPLVMTRRERQIAAEHGVAIPSGAEGMRLISADADWRCPALTDENRCAIYAQRSLICRLYGTVENMKCPHGCVPVGGFLTKEQASLLIGRAVVAGGQPS